MIVGEQKPLEEIKNLIVPYKKILAAGCGSCVAVCFAGGEKEVGILSSSLRMAFKMAEEEKTIMEQTVTRQCETEYLQEMAENINQADAVLSLACGVGVQNIARLFPKAIVLPALNTKFFGNVNEPGVWSEFCLGCGTCVLAEYGGICPVARCSKSLLNGPCGGSQNGKCEVSSETDCGWQMIYDRMKALGQLDKLLEVKPPKDWSTAHHGGPRKIIREDLKK